MNKVFIRISFLFIVGFSSLGLHAQVNRCSLNLIEAREQFNAGQIESVPKLLLDCIESGFTGEDKIEAYILLINAYLFDDYPDQADKYMLRFLSDFPQYEPKPEDPFEFVDLFSQFDNNPRFALGFSLGTNVSFIGVTEPFDVSGTASPAEYKHAAGFQLGGVYNRYLKPVIGFSIEPSLSFAKLKKEQYPFEFSQVSYTEKQTRLVVPVSLTYAFPMNNISPYLRVGLSPALLLSAAADFQRTYLETGGTDYDDIISEGIDIADQRASLQIAPLIGAGVRYELEGASFFADLRFTKGLTQQVKSASRTNATDDALWLFYQSQDSFVWSDLSFVVGYARNFYKPRRKK